MALKKVVLAGFSGHSPRWFRFHGSMIDIVAVSGAVSQGVQKWMDDFHWNGRRYDDPAAMICAEPADLAFIWTRGPEQHVPLGLLALERGMHVMLEKPLSEDADEAKRFVDAVAKSGRRAMVMQDIRWQNTAIELKQAWDGRTVGEPHSLDVTLIGSFTAFTYEGIHIVDLTRYLAERDAQWVYAAGASPAHKPLTRDNVISLHIGYAGGLVARAVLDWSSLGHHHWIEVRVHGERGVMKAVWGQPLQVQLAGQEPARRPLLDEENNSMKRLLRHFLDRIEDDGELINSVADQLKTLDIIFAGWESMRRNEVVRLPFKV